MTQNYLPWYVERGDGPLVAVAIHNGHAVRDELQGSLALSEAERLREEDPFTGEWTNIAPTRVVALQSRFEFDLNRPREKAVYEKPEDAWELRVWKDALSGVLKAKSLVVYDSFYEEMRGLLERVVARHGRAIVYDLHSYNHRRNGPSLPPADSRHYPEVSLGTKTMDRERWSAVVDRFIVDLRNFDFLGRHLDVRENVVFGGGQFPQWVHSTFPESVCVLSIEVKKFFMDEWTGKPEPLQVETVGRALKSTVWGIHEELVKMDMASGRVPA